LGPLILANQAVASEEVALIVKIFIPFAIGTIMLAMGLGLRTVDFRRVLLEPRAVVIGVICQILLLPLVGFGLAMAFELSEELAVGLVLITAAPGGPSSNLYSHLARGDTALSVTLTAISGIVTIVTIPIIMHIALGTFAGEARTVEMPITDTMLQIALLVGLPVGLGMFVRHHRPRIADRAESIFKGLAILLLILLIAGAVSKESKRIGEFAEILLTPILLLSLGTMALGLSLALLMHLSRRQAITIGIEVGMQNGALAIGLAMGSLGSETIAMPAVIYSILAYFTCGILLLLGRAIIPH